jgi:prophage maintenance system killer protein
LETWAVLRILYPTLEEVIETNKRVLEIVVDKRDRHVVWGEDAITAAIDASKRAKGDVYDKAAVLLIELVKGHPFKSGNRRTATAVVADFLRANNHPFRGQGTKVLAGIRLGDFKRADVKAWLKGLDE